MQHFVSPAEAQHSPQLFRGDTNNCVHTVLTALAVWAVETRHAAAQITGSYDGFEGLEQIAAAGTFTFVSREYLPTFEGQVTGTLDELDRLVAPVIRLPRIAIDNHVPFSSARGSNDHLYVHEYNELLDAFRRLYDQRAAA
jgi:hypothetical protein